MRISAKILRDRSASTVRSGMGGDAISTILATNLEPGIKPEDVPRLKVKWAWTHPGPMATGQPTIIGDRLFITTEVGQLFSLNAQTGCTYWTMNAGAGLRSASNCRPSSGWL